MLAEVNFADTQSQKHHSRKDWSESKRSVNKCSRLCCYIIAFKLPSAVTWLEQSEDWVRVSCFECAHVAVTLLWSKIVHVSLTAQRYLIVIESSSCQVYDMSVSQAQHCAHYLLTTLYWHHELAWVFTIPANQC